jgi:RNA polymerase sigma factor for flagellar operon FliA
MIPDERFTFGDPLIERALTAALERLPERERMVVCLYFFEDMTFRAIGEVFGVTESRVCQLWMKARDRLAEDPALTGAA